MTTLQMSITENKRINTYGQGRRDLLYRCGRRGNGHWVKIPQPREGDTVLAAVTEQRKGRVMRTKDRVRRYREKHPDATVRQIQAALRLSSPSVVQFHLTQNSKQDEVKALRDENKLLRAQIGNIESAWRNLWEKAGRPAGVPKL